MTSGDPAAESGGEDMDEVFLEFGIRWLERSGPLQWSQLLGHNSEALCRHEYLELGD